MLEGGMKLNVDDILERKNIAANVCYPLRHIPLVTSDISDHKCWLEKVYKGMLREACVIDDCCRRFEKMFRQNPFTMYRAN